MLVNPNFSHPRLLAEPRGGAPLVSWSGLGIVHGLVERLEVAPVIDSAVRVLRRHKWYTESDHVLTLAYNMLSGGCWIQHNLAGGIPDKSSGEALGCPGFSRQAKDCGTAPR